MRLLTTLLAVTASALFAEAPSGFTSLFNGKDLAGWHGYNPHSVAKLTGEKKDAMLKKMRDEFPQHWSVKDGEIFNPGTGAYATTDKDYGDFELTLEYNMAPKGDSGVYLRGVPQVQIWDPTDEKAFKHGAQLGSGALWNNSPGKPGKDPLVLADKPAGEWNTLRVVMVGARVSIWLNGKQTVDHAILENYYDRKSSVPAKGPICLQTHGAPIRWRNIAIREIAGDEANRILASHGKAGFKSVFNGKDFSGWAGPVENYEIVDGAIVCKKGKGGTPYYDQDLTDFAVRLDFKLPSGGNNGLALRYPGTGNTAYVGMCELQVLDDNYDKVKGKIDPRQVHGSAYGMVGAQRGFQRPIGEWNFQEVTVVGSTIKVELNGFIILDADLSKVDMATVMAKSPHPGKDRKNGFFGFAGHNDPAQFRNIEIKDLAAK
ncbi:MAG: 3-keto-disaccharide hydrolase [Opitutales bacterium]